MTFKKTIRRLIKKFRKWLDTKFDDAPVTKPRRKYVRKAKKATPFSPETIPLVAETPKSADPILGG